MVLQRALEEALARNRELEEENRALRDPVQVRRPAKGRSPAEWRFRVLRWELIDIEIHPRADPLPKTIQALRVHVPLEDKPEDVPYWDITSKRVIAALLPVLPRIAGTNTYVRFRQHGRGVGSYYSVDFEPA